MDVFDSLHVTPDLLFQLLGTDGNLAQIVVLPGQRILTFEEVVVYCSNHVQINRKNPWIRSQNPFKTGVSLESKSKSNEYLAVGRHNGGPILALDPDVLERDLIVRETSLLAVFQSSVGRYTCKLGRNGVNSRDKFAKVSGKGVVLLQRGGQIMEKRLGSGENLLVPEKSLVAFTSDVTMAKAEAPSFKWQLMPRNWLLLSVTGPGFVYLSPEERGETPRTSTSPGDLRAIASIMYPLNSIMIILLLFLDEVSRSIET